MQIPLKRGLFAFLPAADNEHSLAVVVIDESLAQKYFPDRDPIGQYLDLNNNPADPDKVPNPQIIGVVGHVNQWGLDKDAASPLHAQMHLPVRKDAGQGNTAQWIGVLTSLFASRNLGERIWQSLRCARA